MIRYFLSCGLLILGLATQPALAQQASPEDLTSRAEAGDTAAQTALAFAYHRGDGVVQNFATAAEWAARAAQAGDPSAQNLLGRYYHGGFGVEQSQMQALRWLTEAANSGNPQFLQDLGQALENGADGSSDPAAAAQAYTLAANAGHLDAAINLGLLYQEGRGVAQDFDRARSLYEAAAEQGNPRALNNLGLLFVRGHGVGQDYKKAAELFAASAEQGMPEAMRNLGVMYENGFGVPLDEARATELYRQAGQTGPGTEITPALSYDPRLKPLPEDPGLMKYLRQVAQAGDPVARFQLAWVLLNSEEPDFAAISEAGTLLKSAAASGYGPAMRNLGLLYFEGRGVPQDYVLGRMWLTLASQAGQADAPDLILALGKTMTPGQINQAQALAEQKRENNP